MEDVIFNGSDMRRPGEVRLRLSDVLSGVPGSATTAVLVEGEVTVDDDLPSVARTVEDPAALSFGRRRG